MVTIEIGLAPSALRTLGAKGSGRRNFELGFVTDDALLLDQVQALFEHLWNGGECGSCRLHDECPGPLSQLRPR